MSTSRLDNEIAKLNKDYDALRQLYDAMAENTSQVDVLLKKIMPAAGAASIKLLKNHLMEFKDQVEQLQILKEKLHTEQMEEQKATNAAELMSVRNSLVQALQKFVLDFFNEIKNNSPEKKNRIEAFNRIFADRSAIFADSETGARKTHEDKNKKLLSDMDLQDLIKIITAISQLTQATSFNRTKPHPFAEKMSSLLNSSSQQIISMGADEYQNRLADKMQLPLTEERTRKFDRQVDGLLKLSTEIQRILPSKHALSDRLSQIASEQASLRKEIERLSAMILNSNDFSLIRLPIGIQNLPSLNVSQFSTALPTHPVLKKAHDEISDKIDQAKNMRESLVKKIKVGNAIYMNKAAGLADVKKLYDDNKNLSAEVEDYKQVVMGANQAIAEFNEKSQKILLKEQQNQVMEVIKSIVDTDWQKQSKWNFPTRISKMRTILELKPTLEALADVAISKKQGKEMGAKKEFYEIVGSLKNKSHDVGAIEATKESLQAFVEKFYKELKIDVSAEKEKKEEKQDITREKHTPRRYR
jgi:hypothetical protein